MPLSNVGLLQYLMGQMNPPQFSTPPALPGTNVPAMPDDFMQTTPASGIGGAQDPFTLLLQQYLTNPSGFMASTGDQGAVPGQTPPPGAVPPISDIFGSPASTEADQPYAEPTAIPGAGAPDQTATPPPGYAGPSDALFGPQDTTAVLPATPADTPTGATGIPPVTFMPSPPPGVTGDGGVQGPIYAGGDTTQPQGDQKTTNNLGLPLWTNYIPQIAAINMLVGVPGTIGHVLKALFGGAGDVGDALSKLGPEAGKVLGSLGNLGHLFSGGSLSLPQNLGGWGQPMGFFGIPAPPGIGQFGAPGEPGTSGFGDPSRGGTVAGGGITWADILASGVLPLNSAAARGGTVPAPGGWGGVFGQGSYGDLSTLAGRLSSAQLAKGGDPSLGFGGPGDPIVQFNAFQGPEFANQIKGSFPGYANWPSTVHDIPAPGAGAGYHPPSLPDTSIK